MSNDDTFSLGDLKNRADPNIDIQALRAENKKLRNALRRQQVEYGDLVNYFNELRIAVEDAGLVHEPLESLYAPEGTKPGKPIIAVAHFTDWHMGAVQEPEEIEDMGEFNPQILEHRILKQYVPRFLEWVHLHRNSYQIDELVILDTGDNISGGIHEELRATDAFPPPVQAVKAAELKSRAIALLAQHFDTVTVHFLVADNHSRLTRKPQCKQEGMNSHNYTVGYITKVLTQNVDGLKFNLYPMNRKVVDVNKRKYLLMHGHDARGWAGFPWYGIERMVGKEAEKRMWSPDDYKFHRVVMGHWHTPLCSPTYWVGGSLQGTDAYDHKCGRKGTPSQSAWMVHPQHGEFDRIDFLLK